MREGESRGRERESSEGGREGGKDWRETEVVLKSERIGRTGKSD